MSKTDRERSFFDKSVIYDYLKFFFSVVMGGLTLPKAFKVRGGLLTSLRRSLELSASRSRGATDTTEEPVSLSEARPLSSLVAGS